MCLVKKPKVVQPTSTADKILPVLRNPYLDGLDPLLKARAGGVRGLTINRGQTPTIPRSTNPTTPVVGGGGGSSSGAGSGAGGGSSGFTDNQLQALAAIARPTSLLLKAK